MGMVGADFRGGFFQTGLGNLENGFIARFIGFGFFIRRLGKLGEDKAAAAVFPIFGVQLHHGVGGCAGAGEKVEDEVGF